MKRVLVFKNQSIYLGLILLGVLLSFSSELTAQEDSALSGWDLSLALHSRASRNEKKEYEMQYAPLVQVGFKKLPRRFLFEGFYGKYNSESSSSLRVRLRHFEYGFMAQQYINHSPIHIFNAYLTAGFALFQEKVTLSVGGVSDASTTKYNFMPKFGAGVVSDFSKRGFTSLEGRMGYSKKITPKVFADLLFQVGFRF